MVYFNISTNSMFKEKSASDDIAASPRRIGWGRRQEIGQQMNGESRGGCRGTGFSEEGARGLQKEAPRVGEMTGNTGREKPSAFI
jgi:hypothetical protein